MLVTHRMSWRASTLFLTWLVALASFPLAAQTWQDFSITIVGVAVPPGPTAPIPTLSEWGMIFLVVLMTGIAWFRYRRNDRRTRPAPSPPRR